MLSHTKDLPFRCEYCSAGYKEKRNLKKHMIKSHPEIEQSDLWQSHYLSLKEESGSSADMEKSKMENMEGNVDSSYTPWMGRNNTQEEGDPVPLSQGFRRDSEQSTSSSSYNGNNSSNASLRRDSSQQQLEVPLSPPAGAFRAAAVPHLLSEGFKRESEQQQVIGGSNTYPMSSETLRRDSSLPLNEELKKSQGMPATDFRGASVPHPLIEGFMRKYDQSASNTSFPYISDSFSHPPNEHLNRVHSGITPTSREPSVTPGNDFRETTIPTSINQ